VFKQNHQTLQRANLQILIWGVGFGGLHILFGILIGRMGHGQQI
jgi:hypothetical protein